MERERKINSASPLLPPSHPLPQEINPGSWISLSMFGRRGEKQNIMPIGCVADRANYFPTSRVSEFLIAFQKPFRGLVSLFIEELAFLPAFLLL
jgi:hypothetical protein